jgi:ABC-type glycerol-3-phosphate transport system substrate-binding protein
MGIDFNWQAGDEGGQWEVIAEQRQRKRRRWIPRWLRYLLLATIALAAAGGYVVVRQRYQQAHQQMVFQIQGVIDLEADAYARGDADLFMGQQDDASPDWYDLQQERIGADCPRDAQPSARCVPVLPGEILEVDLREDVAWVEVLEDEPPVRRVRFYHQAELGWKHTAPQLAFWGHAIELHYGDLVFRYHERDRPHVDPLIDHIADVFYKTCAHVDCPLDRSFQVNFAVDSVLSTGILPPFQDSEWILPSPWLSGLPVGGEWSEAQLDALAYAIAHGLATQTLRTAPEQQLDPLQRALVAEYAAWQGTGRRDAAPLLNRIVDRRGDGVLPPLFRWLRDDQQRHTLGALLGRWLDYPVSLFSAQHFQELLQIERDALLAGQRDTFMLLQEGEQAMWRSQQEAFYEQAGDALRSTSVSLPSVRVESVRVSRGRAMVTLREPLVNVRGEAAQSLGQYVFFTLDREGWRHSSIGHALHWRVPFSMVRRVPSLPRQEVDPDVTWITYASSEPHSQVEARTASFYAQHPGIRVRVLDMGDVLSFPDEGLSDENDLILYLYQLLAYQGALMSDVMDLPVFSESSLYGLARDLTPFLEEDSALLQDFYPGLLRACQQDGKTWALPERGYPFLIFYDKDAFDEAELPYPQRGWSEADFLEAARQLTVREGEEVRRYGFLNRTGWPIGRAFVEGQVGPLIEGSHGVPLPRLDTPKAVEAVRWYTNLALQEQVMPNPFEWLSSAGQRAYLGQMWNVVPHGQAAMWVDDAQAGDRGASGNVGVVSFPTSTYPSSPWLVKAYAISAESAHPEESWAWLAFLTEQQKTRDDHNNTAYTVPARRSVAELSRSWAQWDDEAGDAIRSAMEDAWAYRLDECTLALEAAIESIWAGTSVEAALDEAQAQLMGQ